MRETARKYIMFLFITGLFSICLLVPGTALSEESGISGIHVVNSSGVDLEARIYNYTTGEYDQKITWNNTDFSQPTGWAIADQCLEIAHSGAGPSWGIQIYSDNMNNAL